MIRSLTVKLAAAVGVSTATILAGVSPSWARDINYKGNEETVYVKPGEPTQITFPTNVEGGFKPANSAIKLEKKDRNLIVFPRADLSVDGEAFIVVLEDKRTYSFRIAPTTESKPRDGIIKIIDEREPDYEEGTPQAVDLSTGPRKWAPTNTVSGFMREMVLVAEFGKQRGIPGYRRSNTYSGETVLNDGAIEAKIDEIYMGTDLWGYVVNVENKLQTTQQINPATFRMDGTRAVGAERWELAPQPQTEEQKLAKAHVAKIYIITRAKRR